MTKENEDNSIDDIEDDQLEDSKEPNEPKESEPVKKSSKKKKESSPKEEKSDPKTEVKSDPKPEPKPKAKDPPVKSDNAYRKSNPDFYCLMKDGKKIQKVFEAYAKVISETRIKVTKNSIIIIAMDGSHICLVSLELKREDCDEYKLTDESGILEVGVNFEDLVKILKRSGTKDEIKISIFNTNKRFLIEMKPENGKKWRTFSLSMIDIDVEEINMESLNAMKFDNSIKMNVDYMDEAIKDAEIFSEVLQVKVKDKLIFLTEGSIGDMEYILEKDELQEATLVNMEENSYAIQFLKSVFCAENQGLAKTFLLKVSKDSPLYIEYKIFENSTLRYFLAPRVEEDTDTMYEQ